MTGNATLEDANRFHQSLTGAMTRLSQDLRESIDDTVNAHTRDGWAWDYFLAGSTVPG